MIKGYCTTNDDELRKLSWPTEFVSVPLPGDYVKAVDNMCIGKICRITHCHNKGAEPHVEIELSKPYVGA